LPKIANYLHQPKMLNGRKVFAQFQVFESKWGFEGGAPRGFEGGAPSARRFLGLTTKIINQGRI